MIDYVKALAQTMMEAHDRLYVEQANYARTIPIPTLGVGTTEFDLSTERALALYDSGRWAAEKFLATWDFDAYIAEFRSGKEHSRREVAQVMAAEDRSRTRAGTSPTALGDQLVAQSGRDGLRARGDAELRHRGAELRPRGVRRDEELAPDRLVRMPVGEQPQDVPFAGSEADVEPGVARISTSARPGSMYMPAAATVPSARTSVSSGASLST